MITIIVLLIHHTACCLQMITIIVLLIHHYTCCLQMITIIVLLIHHKGNHDNHNQLPHWARKFFLHLCAKVIGMARYITPDAYHDLKLQPLQDKH